MSRSTRRAVSWIGTLAVLAVCGVGVAHLPGSGGTAEELRWLLGRDRIPPQGWNRAAGLIILAEKQNPGARRALFKDLLWDRDPRLVQGAITLWANQYRGPFRPPDDLEGIFTDWFLVSTPEERLRYQPALLVCCGYMPVFRGLDRAALSVAIGDWRWLVAGTLWRQHDTRFFLDHMLFRVGVAGFSLSSRLVILDGDAHFPWKERLAPLTPDCLEATLWLSVDELVGMLTDKDDRVRWGAGRILAAAGDPRGLPALRDWVKHNPQLMPNTDKLMTALFGPNWRTLGARGSSTRQSSPGDGGH